MSKKDNDSLVLEIAETIKKHRTIEATQIKRNDKNLAIALSNVFYTGEKRKIWLTNKENTGGYKKTVDITGFTSTTSTGGTTTITTDGNVVYKNNRIGEILIKNSKGKHPVQTPRGKQTLEIFNFSSFAPNPHNNEATDVLINVNEVKPRIFQSLNQILNYVEDVQTSISDLEEEKLRLEEIRKKEEAELEALIKQLEEEERTVKLEEEKKRLIEEQEKERVEIQDITNRIDEQKRNKDRALEEAHSFIRKNAELRYQPILDPWQEEIKRSNIFDYTIAIDGGPGTGKTTALIQRIKFLIDKEAMLGSVDANGGIEVEGYFSNMSKTQQDKLFDNNNNWVFFTPNELLKLFLRNSMIQEGLNADDSRVLIWTDYLNVLVRKYKLVNPETKNPFLILRKYTDVDILPHEGKYLKRIISSFESYFLKELNDRLQKLSNIDVSQFSWKSKGLSIQKYINRQEKDYSIEGLIRLYFNIQENFGEEVKQLTSDFNSYLKSSAVKLLRSVNSDEQLKEQVFSFAETWIKESSSIEDESSEEEDEELEEDKNDIETYLFGKLKILIKNKALTKYDSSVKLSKKYRELLNLIQPVVEIDSLENYDDIGQLGYFNKYFVRSSKGIVSNIIIEIPKAYKGFRKEELKNRKNKWNFKILEYIVDKDKSKNKRIHTNEQSLLIYFINSIVVKSNKVSKLKTKKINHSYFEAFREVSVPVIGVDEATDFHIIDLLAIHSLSDNEISSVTYSGDIMQRLTDGGIRKWDELKAFIKKFDEKKLEISYRQSPTLLDVATTIYNKATGFDAEYISFMDKDEKEPKPLLYKDDDEYGKIEWISERILEIYKAYGNWIPSIAIFLPDEGDIAEFAKELGEIDDLADVGIQVKASNKGQVLGDANTVRVFSIQYIKGMEFEAAFFHNIQKVSQNYNNEEMVLKNLYVGLSRASFYMAVTSDEDVESIEFLDEIFETEVTNWQ